MRIAFIDFQIDHRLGGGSMYSLDLTARELVRRGHQVTVVTLDSKKNAFQTPPTYRVEALQVPTDPLRVQDEVLRILKRHEGGFDLFHVYDAALAPAGGRYRRQGGRRPVAVTLNSYFFCTNFVRMDGQCHRHCDVARRILHATQPLPIKLASVPVRMAQSAGFADVPHNDAFLPDSESVRTIYREYGLPDRKMTVIPEMIDTRTLSAGQKARTLRTPPRLLFVGRLERNKGVHTLLEALRTPGLPAMHLDVVGSGTQEAALKQAASTLPKGIGVTFHGYVPHDELAPIYQQADLFVHPGEWLEPFGRTVVEAMCFGLPCIVSDCGAPATLIGPAGSVFRRADASDLAQKLKEMLSDGPEYGRMSAAALEQAQKFDYRASVDALESVYRQLASGA